MCGIAGIVSFNKEIELNTIRCMTKSIQHRGPDGDGHWIDPTGHIALGHRRLSIIDLSEKGKQPMHYKNRYTITFNGEIYNYLEIKDDLEDKGYSFISDSDTEVLLALYDQKKEDCLHDLDGMFAFAIWDAVEEVLFCARDRFGEKPFHYAVHEDAVYFASEMKALWAAGVPKRIDEEMQSYFNLTLSTQKSSNLQLTYYHGIHRLVHSHWMKIDIQGNIQIQKYYDINWKEQNKDISFEDACSEFNRLFQLGLTRRFRADVPIGTSLSGGLDSSSIVCNLSQYVGQSNPPQIRFLHDLRISVKMRDII